MKVVWFAAIIFGILFLLLAQNGNAAVANPLVRCMGTASLCSINSTMCQDILTTCIRDCNPGTGKDIMSGEDINAENCQSGKAQGCYYCLNGNVSAIQPTAYSSQFGSGAAATEEFYRQLPSYMAIIFGFMIMTGILFLYATLNKNFKKYRTLSIILFILEIAAFLILLLASGRTAA